jgi:hypothetical protein
VPGSRATVRCFHSSIQVRAACMGQFALVKTLLL